MKKLAIVATLVAALCISLSSFAQVPSNAPAGTTGLCNDGSFSASANKNGACQGHKGVKAWYGAATIALAAGSTAVATTGDTGVSATPGGGPGKVWVNTRTKIYHCPGDKAYGKTRQGQYMSEAAAKATGDRPAHGKFCM